MFPPKKWRALRLPDYSTTCPDTSAEFRVAYTAWTGLLPDVDRCSQQSFPAHRLQADCRRSANPYPSHLEGLLPSSVPASHPGYQDRDSLPFSFLPSLSLLLISCDIFHVLSIRYPYISFNPFFT